MFETKVNDFRMNTINTNKPAANALMARRDAVVCGVVSHSAKTSQSKQSTWHKLGVSR